MTYYKRLISLLTPYKIYIFLMSLLMIVTTIGNIALPIIQRNIIDNGIMSHDPKAVMNLTIIIVTVILICKIVAYAQSVIQTRLNLDFKRKLEMDVLNHALRLKIIYITKEGLLKLVKQAGICINSIAELTGAQVITSFFEIFKIIGLMIGMSFISWRLTIFLLLLVPIRLLIANYFTKRVEENQTENINAHRKIHQWEQDMFLGINEIKLWNLYDTKEKEYETVLNQRDCALKKLCLNIYKSEHIGSGIEELCVCGIYLLCGYFIFDTQLSIGGIVTFITYSRLLMQPIGVFVLMRLQLAKIRPSLNSYDDFFSLETESQNAPPAYKNIVEGEHVRDLTFRNVSFSFEEKMILDKVNFTISQGEKIAIIGENGVGKSTILNLLLKFWTPESGEILVNGININEFALDEYRNIFSTISQTPYLFDGSIKENLTIFGKIQCDNYNNQPLLSFIDSLVDGENTQVGNNSTQISGGEKQKIALFRAFFKSSRILLMDEPTASYDIDSEKAFADVLQNNNKDISIIITHNQTLLEYVDRILLLKKGHIHEYKSFRSFVDSIDYSALS